MKHFRAFTRNTARASARVLLRPRSHTTAFHSASCQATFTWPTRPCTELPNPEAAVLPALVSVFDSKVTSLGPMMTRSVWVCAAFRQAILSWRFRTRFPSYETRSSGYQPHTVFRSSAPSLQNLTGKRSFTYSIAPFVVELFTVECLARSPRWSSPVLPVARQQLPTPAALNELT